MIIMIIFSIIIVIISSSSESSSGSSSSSKFYTTLSTQNWAANVSTSDLPTDFDSLCRVKRCSCG